MLLWIDQRERREVDTGALLHRRKSCLLPAYATEPQYAVWIKTAPIRDSVLLSKTGCNHSRAPTYGPHVTQHLESACASPVTQATSALCVHGSNPCQSRRPRWTIIRWLVCRDDRRRLVSGSAGAMCIEGGAHLQLVPEPDSEICDRLNRHWHPAATCRMPMWETE
jgi:hypothetical protein